MPRFDMQLGWRSGPTVLALVVAALVVCLWGSSGNRKAVSIVEATTPAATAPTGRPPGASYRWNRRIYMQMNRRAEGLRREVNSDRPDLAHVRVLKRELASLAGQLR